MSEKEPHFGARIRLERKRASAELVEYEIRIWHDDDGERSERFYSAPATISLPQLSLAIGEWRLDGEVKSPPEWATDFTLALLRTVAKNHAGDGDWPRRITRWRAER
jgi:hypothetical protein